MKDAKSGQRGRREGGGRKKRKGMGARGRREGDKKEEAASHSL